MAVHMLSPLRFFGGDLFCVVFSQRVSLVGSGIEFGQFLKNFLLLFQFLGV